VVNADLANVLGNFVNRVMGLAARQFGGRVPPIGVLLQEERDLIESMRNGLAKVTAYHEALEFRKAAAATRSMWALGNAYFQKAAPWQQQPDQEGRRVTSLVSSLNLAAMFALVAMPFVPGTASQLLLHLGIPPEKWAWPQSDTFSLDGIVGQGSAFTVPAIPFSRVEDVAVEMWRAKFGAA
jgi:methionyl-tRNA synthetase